MQKIPLMVKQLITKPLRKSKELLLTVLALEFALLQPGHQVGLHVLFAMEQPREF